jgi:PHO85 cyclin-1
MEVQFLHLLDYNLRFDEAEAIAVLAPFINALSSVHQHEARVAAVERVVQGRNARTQAQRPLTPRDSVIRPVDTALSVHALAKRLSNTQLSASASSVPMCTTSSGGSNASTTDSEMGSLTDDSGSSSSECGISSEEEGTEGSERQRFREAKRFAPRANMSENVYRHQGRKPSDTSSITTLKGSEPPLSGRFTSSQRVVSYYARGRGDKPNNPSSTTISRGGNETGGFLSRLWCSAKGQQDKDACSKMGMAPPVVDIIEHGDNIASGTFRRLVRSRSSFFRNGSQVLEV